jgi:predicted amidohydrolase
MRIGMAQTHPVFGDVQANVAKTLQLMQQKKEEVDLIVFPELSLSGYLLKDKLYDVALSLESPEIKEICETSRETQVSVVIGFVEEGKGDIIYNSAALVKDGQLSMVQRKIYPPTYGIFDEGKFFAKGKCVNTDRIGSFDVSTLICADLWHPSVVHIAAHKSISLLIGIVNSPEGGLGSNYSSSIGWERVGQFYSGIYGCYVVLVNRVGKEDTVSFYGNSMVIDPHGNIIERCPYIQEDFRICEIDIKHVKAIKRILPTMRDEDAHFTIRQLSKIVDE